MISNGVPSKTVEMEKQITMKTSYLLFLFTFTALGLGAQFDTKQAKTSAQNWLSMIDAHKYEQSWKESAEILKTKVSAKDLQISIEQARKPMGKLVTRKLKSENAVTSLPGAPDGKYVVLEFETIFENKKNALETVTPMLDKDGAWRVSGYFIK